jgi:membrane protein implicated in regulation of membrane protease activity
VDPWVWWIVAAVLLGIIEVVTGGALVFGMLAVGALAASLAAAGGYEWLPWIVFAAVSGGMIVLVRPIARRHLRMPLETRSGAAALLGADAEVTQVVTGRDGRVKLRGEIWSARSYDGQTEFAEGQTVQVLKIDGATALVG